MRRAKEEGIKELKHKIAAEMEWSQRLRDQRSEKTKDVVEFRRAMQLEDSRAERAAAVAAAAAAAQPTPLEGIAEE